MAYEPKPEHLFTFGLWTVGNPGADPFGDSVRKVLSPVEIVELLADAGAWGRQPPRQRSRFGSANPKAAFFLVKFLEDVGYEGSCHFDAHAYRTSDHDDVKAFAMSD